MATLTASGPSTLLDRAAAKQTRALYALLDLSKALSTSIDLDGLLNVIVAKASSVIDADRTSIFVYDRERDRLWTRAAQGLGSAIIELPVGSGVAGDVARTRTLTNIADAYGDRRFNPQSDVRIGYHTRSILCAPVIDSSGALLGVIQSVNKLTAPRFDHDDEILMEALAGHVAVAFERARLTQLAIENERFEQSLKVAREIQMRMLPPRTIDLPDSARFRLQADMRPAKEVGGDLYDYLRDGDSVCFCIADVSGKGVGAALVMALTRTLFRGNATLQKHPALLMSAVNAHLHAETDTSMFVTALCGILNCSDGSVAFANAGHDRPLIVSPDGSVRVVEPSPGMALGVMAEYPFTVQRETLRPGESLFLYTDGLTDAINEAGELFSLDRLCTAITSPDPRSVVQQVFDSVDAFAGGVEQADDMTAICLQYLGVRS